MQFYTRTFVVSLPLRALPPSRRNCGCHKTLQVQTGRWLTYTSYVENVTRDIILRSVVKGDEINTVYRVAQKIGTIFSVRINLTNLTGLSH